MNMLVMTGLRKLTEVQRFWIVKGRSHVRALIHRCVLCHRLKGAPFRGLPPPPLPDFHVEQGPPFSCTGTDFARPFYCPFMWPDEV